MKQIFLCFSICVLLFSCNDKTKLPDSLGYNQRTIIDSLVILSAEADSFLYTQISETNKIIKEKDLIWCKGIKKEFRFYYYRPLWVSYYLFFKVDYNDSTLTAKEFIEKSPAGTWCDSLISSKEVKLKADEVSYIDWLIDKSMFWELISFREQDRIAIDGSDFIYEGKRENNKYFAYERIHHIVKRHSPTNTDFQNLGYYLMKKTGFRNEFKEN